MNDDNAYDIEVTRVFDTARERTYKAFTDAAQFARWYGPIGFPVERDTIELETGIDVTSRLARSLSASPSNVRRSTGPP